MFTDIIKRFQELDNLIQNRETGTAAELAKKIGVSERTLYQYIKQMRDLGAPIDFNERSKTYFYSEKGTFNCSFSFLPGEIDKKKANLSVVKLSEFLLTFDNSQSLNYN